MARPLRIEYPGAFYHVTSRGNEQKDIFRSRRDREQFLSYLQTASERYGAVIHAYCLMSNHYHLLLKTPEGNLSQIMRHINGAYTTYFNIKRKRAGHLFQGRYKAIIVDADAYALELSRYIHLNPLRTGMVIMPEKYEWSSYRNFTGFSETPEWLKTGFILDCINAKNDISKYREFVENAINQENESPLNGVIASTILGSAEFIKDISSKHLREKTVDRNVPAVRKLSRPAPDEIISAIGQEPGMTESFSRNVSIYFCHRFSGARLREIGERFGLSDAAVSQASRRMRVISENDAVVRKQLEQIKSKLGL
ncbi:MAG TPA: hypothetical protein HPP97_06485 [Desulfuromonadales bacterium]|nr:hypothetical protein [Desulfuromonadales bacterium]